MATPDNAEDGYILEVVLEYRTELYELHSDYPLVPEKMRVTLNILYPYCQQLVQDLNLDGAPVPKLVPNLCDKMHYILRYCNLKHDLDLGMKLTMIHRALGFVQYVVKEFTDFNTKKKQASSDFEKDFFKVMNNAIFRKIMENLQKPVNVRLVTNQNN